MKKIGYILLIFFFGIHVSNALAIDLECHYSGSAGNDTINTLCVFYDDQTHICYMEKNQLATNQSNQEKIINYDQGFLNASGMKYFVQNNKKCPPYLVVKPSFMYEIYGCDSLERTNQTIANLSGKRYAISLGKEVNHFDLTDSDKGDSDVTKPEDKKEPPNYHVTDEADIGGLCDKPQYRKPMKFLGILVSFFRIVVPILIVAFGVMDLYKAVTAAKDDEIRKAFKAIIVRALAGVFVFLLPGIVQFVLNMVKEWSDYKNDWCCCTDCLLNPDCDVNSCNSNSCHIEGTNE